MDGLRASVGGGSKIPHLIAHLAELRLTGPDCVLIVDSVDDAHAADAVGARMRAVQRRLHRLRTATGDREAGRP